MDIFDWIKTVAERSSDDIFSRLEVPVICAEGHRTYKTIRNLQISGCKLCNRRVNEKITGAMLDIIFGREFIFGSSFDKIGENIGEKDEILYFPDAESMEIDYYCKINLGKFFQYLVSNNIIDEIPASIRGDLDRDIIIVVESDGGQHRKNGFGFLTKLGLIATSAQQPMHELFPFYTKKFREIMKEQVSIKDVEDEINKFSDKRLMRAFKQWKRARERDDYRDEKVDQTKEENKIPGSEKTYPTDAYMIRVPTWKLNNEERIEHIFKEFGKKLGLSEAEFFNRLNLDGFKAIAWRQLINE